MKETEEILAQLTVVARCEGHRARRTEIGRLKEKARSGVAPY